jgi:hypothetical protein
MKQFTEHFYTPHTEWSLIISRSRGYPAIVNGNTDLNQAGDFERSTRRLYPKTKVATSTKAGRRHQCNAVYVGTPRVEGNAVGLKFFFSLHGTHGGGNFDMQAYIV